MNKIMQLLHDNKGRSETPVNMVRNESEATIYIYDVISGDWGVSAASVIQAITMAGDAATINFRVNSPGGEVFESRAIMNAIKRCECKTVAHIDSLCASAATSIAIACDEVVMASDAMYMIHNAQGMAWGDKTDMRETADLMEKVEVNIIDDYTTKTGKPKEEIAAMMDDETWMSAEEALANGFIDRIAETKTKTKNTWNLAAYKNAPPALTDPPSKDEEPTEEPAAAGIFSSAKNANRLKLAQL